MPPRLNIFAAARALSCISQAPAVGRRNAKLAELSRSGVRCFANSNKDLPLSHDGQEGPNTDTLPSISEEAAAISKTTGSPGPELEQGTPVEEIVKGDKQAEKNLPKVMRDELKSKKPSNSRSFSTSVTRRQSLPSDMFRKPPLSIPDGAIISAGTTAIPEPESATLEASRGPKRPGAKFEVPTLPIPSTDRMKHRYEPIVEQLTGLLIRHGKKGVAQRNVNYILSYLRASPPPKLRADRPLLPGHPPASHLPLHPVLYLQLAVDSVAPLLRIRAQRGAAGGGMALQIPIPLRERTRRRTAIMWILDAASKRSNRGSGKYMFAQRIAEEIIAVVEGRSTVWEKRSGIHKVGVLARANIFYKPYKK